MNNDDKDFKVYLSEPQTSDDYQFIIRKQRRFK